MEPQMQGATVSLIGIKDLFRNSLALYRNRFVVFASIMAFPTILSIAQLFTKGELGITLLLVFLTVAANFFSGIGLVVAALGTQSTKEVFQSALSKIGSYAWIIGLAGAINIGGLVMAIIPAIVFSFWFMFGPFLLVDFGMRGMSALMKSKEYVRGYWWPVFGRSLLLGLAVMIISIIFGMFAQGVPGANPGEFVRTPAEAIAFSILIFFLMPFLISYQSVIYQSLKSAKPNLAGTPSGEKKGFFIFSAILGVLGPIIILIAVAVGGFLLYPKLFPNNVPNLEVPGNIQS